MTNSSLMKVKSIAECSPWSILQYFWPALSNESVFKTNFGLLFEWPLMTDFTVSLSSVARIYIQSYNSQDRPLYMFERSQAIISKKYCFFLCRSFLSWGTVQTPDAMQHHAAFNLGLSCLSKYLFWDFLFLQRVNVQLLVNLWDQVRFPQQFNYTYLMLIIGLSPPSGGLRSSKISTIVWDQ